MSAIAGPQQHQTANKCMSAKYRSDASQSRDVNSRRNTKSGRNSRSGGNTRTEGMSTKKRSCSSVADPECLSRIPDPDFYPSRILDPTAIKERGEKKFVSNIFL
jgi:hypothetical protein